MVSLSDRIKQAQLGKTYLFWVGQAGFIVKSSTGKLLGIDMYLSECVERVEGHVGYHRLMPQLLEFDDLTFDVIIVTHFHRDHFDVDAMYSLMDNNNTRLLCALDCQKDVDDLEIDKNRVNFIKPGDIFYIGDFKISFIRSDHGAGAPLEVAPIITVDGRNILEVGDTSLHLDWKDEYLKEGNLDVLIAPINGAYGNLNEQENVSLTQVLKPKLTVPCHFGMFSSHGGHPGLWKELIEKQLPEQKYKIFTMGEGIKL